ncbi:MAG: ankyrin repeat domain-containing protein [Legionellales bacterium]
MKSIIHSLGTLRLTRWNAHLGIMRLGGKMGYDYFTSGGICHGFALSWLSEALVKDEHRFHRRIETIKSGWFLPGKIQAIKKKLQQQIALTDYEKELLELPGFYETVSVYQSSPKLALPGVRFLLQSDTEALFNMVQSKKLEDLGGISVLEPLFFIDTKKEAADYFSSLAQTVEKAGCQSVVGCLLSSPGHAMALTYDSKLQQWQFMDVNQWPPVLFNRNDTLNLVNSISAGFASSSVIGFNQDVLAVKVLPITLSNEPQKDALKKTLPHQQQHRQEQALLELQTEEQKQQWNPVHVAAWGGCATVIAPLAKKGADLDEFDPDGLTATYTAIYNNHPNVIVALAKYSANVNKAFRTGHSSAVHAAACFSKADVIAILAKHGADLGELNLSGYAPIHIAASAGHLNVIIELANQCVNLTQPDKYGRTAYDHARKAGHKDIASFLQPKNNQSSIKIIEQLAATQTSITSIPSKKLTGVGLTLTKPSDLETQQSPDVETQNSFIKA